MCAFSCEEQKERVRETERVCVCVCCENVCMCVSEWKDSVRFCAREKEQLVEPEKAS